MTIVNHPLLCICWYLWISLIPQVIAGLNKDNPTTFVTSNNLVYRRNTERRRINTVFQELIQDVLDGMSENQLGTFFDAEPSARRVAIRMLKHMRSLDYYKIIKNRYLGEKQIENLKNPTMYLKTFSMEDRRNIAKLFPTSNEELKLRCIESWMVIDGFIQTFVLNPKYSILACEKLKEIILILSEDRPFDITLLTFLRELIKFNRSLISQSSSSLS